MIDTQVFETNPVSFSYENSIVNNIDAFPSVEISNFIQIPSVKQDVSKMKPSAIDDKEKEIALIINAVNKLEQEHVSYVDQFVTRGNKALYSVLANIYGLAIQINHSDNSVSILNKLRNQLSLQKNIKTQKNTLAMTLIVRWVVGGSRQVAHTYSKALDAAYKDNIAAKDLADYFTNHGGLNKASKRNNEQLTEKSDIRKFQFSSFMYTADAQYKDFQNTDIEWTEEVFGAYFGGFSLIIASSNGEGKFKGQRAFNLSTDAYNKICKVLADDLFKEKKDSEIEMWVREESKKVHDISVKRKSEISSI